MSKRNADLTALPCPGWSMDTSKFLYMAGHIPVCPSCLVLIVFKSCAWCQELDVLSRSGGQWGLSQVTNSLRSRAELLCPGFGVVCPPAHSEMGGGLYSDELLKKHKHHFAVRPCAQPGQVCRIQSSYVAELLPEGVSLNSPGLASVLCWFISLQCV